MLRTLPVLVFATVLLAGGNDSLTAQQKKADATPKLLDEKKFEVKHHIHALTFSPDGKTLAVGMEDVYLYDLSGAEPKKIDEFKSRVGFGIRSMAFSPDGKFLAFGGNDHTVRVWDLATKKETAHMKQHQGDIFSVAFSPDGKTLATGSGDRTAMLWDLGNDGQLTEQAVIKADDKYADAVRSVVFAQKGKSLVTACGNGTFRVFTLGKPPKQAGGFKTKNGTGDTNLACAPDGKFWVFSDRKTVRMINNSGQEYAEFNGHKEDVRDLAISPDNKLVASVGHDGLFAIWTSGGRKVVVSKDRPGHFTSVAFSPAIDSDGGMWSAAGMENGDVFLMKVGAEKK